MRFKRVCAAVVLYHYRPAKRATEPRRAATARTAPACQAERGKRAGRQPMRPGQIAPPVRKKRETRPSRADEGRAGAGYYFVRTKVTKLEKLQRRKVIR